MAIWIDILFYPDIVSRKYVKKYSNQYYITQKVYIDYNWSSQTRDYSIEYINDENFFKDDPEKKRRSEDAIIAWTWKKFIQNTSDPEILLRMPMTKVW